MERQADFRENVIEWLNGSDLITLTLSQKKHINKVMKLAEENPTDVIIKYVNNDGTILVTMPLSYLVFRKPREYTEEEKEVLRERFLNNISKNKN